MRYYCPEFNPSTNIIINPIGDLHIGSPHYNPKPLLKKLEYIDKHRENNRIILMGDLAETALKASVGAGVYEQDSTPLKQIHKAVELLKPFSSLIDGVVTGNHEQRVYVQSGDDLTEEFCKLMGIEDRYLRYQGIVHYAWNKRSYDISVWHGAGGGAGSSINKLLKQRSVVIADVYLMGHVHQRETAFRSLYLADPGNRKMKKLTQAFVVTGSALEYEESYAEEKGLPPTVTGFPRITLSGQLTRKNTPVKEITLET